VIDHVLGEVDRSAGLGVDREGNLAGIGSVNSLVGMEARTLQNALSRTRQLQETIFRPVAKHNAAVFRIVGSLMKDPPRHGFGQPRIIRIADCSRFRSCHLRGNNNKRPRVENCHRIGDSSYMSVDKGD